MKIYYTYNALSKDLPNLKDTEITVIYDFDKSIHLNAIEYKSFKATLKRQNIKINILDKVDDVDFLFNRFKK